MDSTTVEAVTDLSEAEGSTVGDLSDLRVRWRARCGGQAGTCSQTRVTAILQYIGRDLEYSADAQLQLWAAHSRTYQQVWSSYINSRRAELGRGLAGQSMTYTLPRSALAEVVGQPNVRIGISDEGTRSFYELTEDQKRVMVKFLDSIQ